jgi:signal transduction histidine kinase
MVSFMDIKRGFAGRALFVFILALLPAIAGFWFVLSEAFARSSAADAERSLSAIMNQADRLTYDLDLELSFLDAYLAQRLSTQNGDMSFPDANGIPRDGIGSVPPAEGRQGNDRLPDRRIPYPRFPMAADDASVTSALDAYRGESRWPALVRALYFVEPDVGKGTVSARRVAPALQEAGTDEYLELVEAFYRGTPGEWVDRALLAKVVGIRYERTEGQGAQPKVLVAILDTDVLFGVVMPELDQAYFGPASGFEGFGVAVRDPASRIRYGTGVDQPDFTRPLLRESGRFDVPLFYAMFIPRPSQESSPMDPASFPIDRYRFQAPDLPGGWSLELSHEGLSIKDNALRTASLWSAGSAGFLVLLYGSIIALYASAGRVARLAARERSFVASVTHELKTPIAVALSAGENLEKGIVPPDRMGEYGGVVAREARRLSGSVERLLVMAGIESAQPFRRGEAVPLGEAMEEVLGSLGRFMEEREARVTVATEGTPMAEGSAALIKSALECVVGNAVKYAGGSIQVELSETVRRGRRLACVRCKDTGTGVPRPERRRIFEPFFRGSGATRAGIPGTGVGLYLARRVARLHGGDVHLHFPTEGGMEVELTFRSYV